MASCAASIARSIRRIHGRRAPGVDPDLRRRPGEDGRCRADRRRVGREHRRREHGLSRAEDREAQCRLQPDARAGSCGLGDCGDDQTCEDSCHRENARGLERTIGECSRTGQARGRRRRFGGRCARSYGFAVVLRARRLGAHRSRGRVGKHSRVGIGRLRRAGGYPRPHGDRRQWRARRTGRASESLDSRASRRPRRRPSSAPGYARRSRSVSPGLRRSAPQRRKNASRPASGTGRDTSLRPSAIPLAIGRATKDGSSTNSARSCRGTPRGSTTADT